MEQNNVNSTIRPEDLIDVKDLQVSFFTPAGEVRAVDGISYSLHKNEVMGIVGESGSGKSVEAFTIMGLLGGTGKVKNGQILFEGKDLLKINEKQMEAVRGNDISMIFQNPMTCMNPVYTVGNQLEEALRCHNKDVTREEARTKAIEMLKAVGINNAEQRIDQYPHELSGGMRQRVMIAMGLICHPKLLIADEPTTALDVTTQEQILQLMKKLQEENHMSIILITHNLGVVAEICDSVSVMYAGHIVEQGRLHDIFYHTAHPYTKGLMVSMPRIDIETHERFVPIEGTPVDLLKPPKGCCFAPRCRECRRVCLTEKPPVVEVGENHFSACWLHIMEMRRNQVNG